MNVELDTEKHSTESFSDKKYVRQNAVLREGTIDKTGVRLRH
jgi:hypothetical protein